MNNCTCDKTINAAKETIQKLTARIEAMQKREAMLINAGKDVLAILDQFKYEHDEDSDSSSFFEARMNEDGFFIARNDLGKALSATSTDYEAFIQAEIVKRLGNIEVAFFSHDNDGDENPWSDRRQRRLEEWKSFKTYFLSGQQLAAPEERKELGCQCSACRVTPHASDCAVHNMPAYPNGPCDCGAWQIAPPEERKE